MRVTRNDKYVMLYEMSWDEMSWDDMEGDEASFEIQRQDNVG